MINVGSHFSAFLVLCIMPQRHSKVELGGHVLVNAFYKHPVALPPCQELLGNKLQSSQSKEDTPCLSLDW
jgi:hypothetical protein